MRVLVLGGTGMLGHKLCQVFAPRFETFATARGKGEPLLTARLLPPDHVHTGIDAADFDSLSRAVADLRPAVVVNAIGIIKQSPAAKDPLQSLLFNSVLPHRLAVPCRSAGARLIHISTDCIFSGRKGGYRESDIADAEDLYGRTKFLGEVSWPTCLTLRTSIIGRELQTHHGLVEQLFLHRRGVMPAYRRAIFNGLTTLTLANLLADLIVNRPALEGVWHVAATPITKADLLGLLNAQFGLGVQLVPDDRVVCDRSLDGSRFQAATGWTAPDWPDMIAAMRRDPFAYPAGDSDESAW